MQNIPQNTIFAFDRLPVTWINLQRRHDPQAQGRVFTRQTPARHAQPRQVQPLHRRQG